MFFLKAFSQSKYALSALTGILLSGSVYAGTAGRVNFVVGEATATSPDNVSRALYKGDIINSGDKLETTANGRMQIRFTDGSFLALKPNTTFNIEKYSFSKDTPEQGSLLFNFIRGGMRTISGAIGKVNRTNYRMNTPFATIGIRGTDYSAKVGNDKLFVTVTHGRVNVENDLGNAEVNEGESFVTSKETAPSLCHHNKNILTNKLDIPQPCTPVVLPLETEEGLYISNQKVEKPTEEGFTSYSVFTEAMRNYGELEDEANQIDNEDIGSITPTGEKNTILNTPLRNNRQLLTANALDNKEMRDSSVINDFLQLTTVTNLLDAMDEKDLLKQALPSTLSRDVAVNIIEKSIDKLPSQDINSLFFSLFNPTQSNFLGNKTAILGADFGNSEISVIYGSNVSDGIFVDLSPGLRNKEDLIGLGVLQPSLLTMDSNHDNKLRGFSFKQAIMHDNDGIASNKNSGSLVIGDGSAQQSTVIFTDELTPISINLSLGEGAKVNLNETSVLAIKIITPKLAIKVGDIYVSNSDSSAANIDKDGNVNLGAKEVFGTSQDGAQAVKIMGASEIILGAAKINVKLETNHDERTKIIDGVHVIPSISIFADAFIKDGVTINNIDLKDVGGSIKGGSIMLNSLKITDHNRADLSAKLAVNIEQPTQQDDNSGGVLLSLKQLGDSIEGIDVAISDLRVGSDDAPDIGDIQIMGLNLNGASVLLRGH